MAEDKRLPSGIITDEELNKTIARVILSTKRKNRQYSLLEIANDILALRNLKGGLSEVSKIVGISAGMLNQFLSVLKLPSNVVELVKSREIDSVSMVHYLSKFNTDDSLVLAELLAKKKLSSQDLRILVPYRKQHPNKPIFELVDKIHESKNVKVSVIRLNKENCSKTIDELYSIFSEQIGVENVFNIESTDNYLDIKILKNGEKKLRKVAKHLNKTLQEFITILIT